MKHEILDFFIITGGDDNVNGIISLLNDYLGIKRNTPYRFIFKYEDIDKCLFLINSLKPNTQFRIWAHLGYKDGEYNFKKTFGAFEREIRFLKINLITRQKIDFAKVIEDKHHAFFIGDLDDRESFENGKILINTVSNDSEFNDLSIDYVIIHALEEEFAPFRDFDLSFVEKLDGSNLPIYVTSIVNAASEKKNLLFARAPNQGMIDSAILTTSLIKQFKPKMVFMTGVCGGDPSSQNLSFGDVIIPKQVFTFQKGKVSTKDDSIMSVSDGIFEKELESSILMPGLVQTVENNSAEIIEKINVERFSKFKQYKKFPNTLKVHTDAMACSTVVVNQKFYFESNIKSTSRKAIAVDMESFGVVRACEVINPSIKCLILKSIMDKTIDKNDDAKEYASFTSARFLYHLIENAIV